MVRPVNPAAFHASQSVARAQSLTKNTPTIDTPRQTPLSPTPPGNRLVAFARPALAKSATVKNAQGGRPVGRATSAVGGKGGKSHAAAKSNGDLPLNAFGWLTDGAKHAFPQAANLLHDLPKDPLTPRERRALNAIVVGPTALAPPDQRNTYRLDDVVFGGLIAFTAVALPVLMAE